MQRSFKCAMLPLAVLACFALFSMEATAHLGATRRVGNINVNVSIAGKNEGQAQEAEVFELFVGQYSIHVLLSDMENNWAPIEDAQVALAFIFDRETRSSVTLAPAGKGEYVALGTFDQAGQWVTQATLTLKDKTLPLVLELPWEVSPANEADQSTLWVVLSVAVMAPLILIGGVLFFYLTRKKAKPAK